MVINGVDTQEFGRRVERLCEFFLNKIDKKTGTTEQRILEDIKNDAANLQVQNDGEDLFSGLENHMKGIPQ